MFVDLCVNLLHRITLFCDGYKEKALGNYSEKNTKLWSWKWKSTKDAAAKCSVPGSSHLTWNEKNEWKINDSFITKSKKSKSLYLEKKLTKSC